MPRNLGPLTAILLLASLLSLQAARDAAAVTRFKSDRFTSVSDMAADAAGDIYICGTTLRPDALPGRVRRIGVPAPEQYQAFVLKLRPNGTAVSGIVLGGNAYGAVERMAIDGAGNVIVSGVTTSTNFPVENALEPTSAGGWAPFLCKFNSSLSEVLFSTFLNGLSPGALAVDAQNNILLAGSVFSNTASNFFPEFSPPTYGYDLFVLKLGPEGTNVGYATQFAAHNWGSAVSGIAVDTNGVANVVGMAASVDFPLLNAVQPFKPARDYANAFLTRIDSAGTMISSTFLGGHCGDQAKAVALNAAGEIYVAGITASDVFPALTEFPRTPCSGSNRGFLVRLGPGATNVLDTRTFPVGTQDSVSSLVTFSDGSAVVGGMANAPGYYPGQVSVGFLAKIAPDAPTDVRFLSRDCDERRYLNRLVLTGTGNLLGSGDRILGTRRQTVESYVAQFNLQKLFSTEQPEPEIRVVSPAASSMVGVLEPLTLAAITTAATSDVTAVTFFVDGQALGVATNRPYSIQIPPLPKGRHLITAEAQLPDSRIISCPLPITVRSPRNDDFSRRIRLTGSRVSVSGNNTGATVEPGESFYDTKSVWYSWRAPRDGGFEFSLVGDTFNGTATLLSGDELATLSRVIQLYAGSPLRLRCQRGTVYQIRVANYFDYGSTEFKLQIRPVTGPHNDHFENAEPVSGSSVTVDGSLANATTEVPGMSTWHDVWYAWEAPATGLFLASLDSSDGFVSVFTGSNQADLVEAGQHIYGLTNGSAFYASAGITYFLSVGVALQPSEFTLSITPQAPPQNDAFAERQLIPPGTLSATGSCLGATSEPLEDSPYFSGKRHSVWWRWVAPTSGVFRMTRTVPYPPYPANSSGLSAPRANNDQMTVYSGFALGQLTAVSDSPWSSEVIWPAEAGVEYQIQVSGEPALLVLNIAPVARPTNDYFTNAVLVSSAARVRGTTDGATLETGEPLHGSSFDPPRASVWYQWTAPTSGTFAIDGVWNLRIYTGDAVDSLTSDVYMRGDGVFAAVAGQQYRIAVFDAEDFSLRIRPAFPPPNDAFSNGTLLSGSNLHFTAEFFDASREPDEPPSFYSSLPTRTVWFSWTAPASGNFLLVATSLWTSVLLDVFTGDDLTNLTSVASTAYSQIDFEGVAGVTYHFRADGGSAGIADQAAMQLSSRPSPANDNFSDRLMLTGSSVTITVSNFAATVEPEEPDPYYATGHSVWYSWTAPESGRASFVLDADFDAVLALYTGDTLTNLTNIFVTGTFFSRFNIEVSAGTTYQLAIVGYGESSGLGTLRIRYAPAPANDRFAQRSTLIHQPGTGTLEGATRETAEPGYAEDPSGSSVWWRWTAPTGGIYYLYLDATAYEEVDVYTGTSLASLQTVAPPETAHASVFYFPAQAGVEYAIRISTSFGDFSDYKLFVNYQAPPPNDAFTNRIAFTNGIAGTLKGATHEAGESQIDNYPYPLPSMQDGGSVWFQWTAPESGVFEALTTERWISIDFAVYRGNSLTNLIRASFSQNTPFGYPLNQQFQAVSGETYVILVADSYGWSGADFTLSVRPHISQPPPAPTPVIPVQTSHRLALQPVPGQVVETSTNLVDWRLWTNAAVGPGVPIGPEPQRFFRIR